MTGNASYNPLSHGASRLFKPELSIAVCLFALLGYLCRNYRGRQSAFAASYKGRGVSGEQQTLLLCGVLEILYAGPHPQAQESNMPNIEDVAEMGCCTWERA
jgi:hypothetical protein